MNLTMEERETSILFDANHKTISVWTMDEAIIRRLRRRVGPPTKKHGQGGSCQWELPFTSLDRIVSAVVSPKRKPVGKEESARRAETLAARLGRSRPRIDDRRSLEAKDDGKS